jgi:hypothetical protein
VIKVRVKLFVLWIKEKLFGENKFTGIDRALLKSELKYLKEKKAEKNGNKNKR